MTGPTEGQQTFRRQLARALAGLCVCGRARNNKGKVCCQACRERYGSHSEVCERRQRG